MTNLSVQQINIMKKPFKKAFEQLLAQDDIYLDKYAGWYSVSDEEFFTKHSWKKFTMMQTGK